MKHYEITGPAAIHTFCFMQFADPALDPANKVTARKAWLDLNEERLKIRDATNAAWIYIGQDGALI